MYSYNILLLQMNVVTGNNSFFLRHLTVAMFLEFIVAYITLLLYRGITIDNKTTVLTQHASC